MPPARPLWSWPLIYLGVALTALATLVLELALTRVFSVIFPPYFAFLAVSIALFGLAAGGLFSYLFPGRSPRLLHRLGLTALVNGFSVVGAAAVLLLGEGRALGTGPAGVVAAAMVPFFLSGTILATAVAEALSRVNRIGLAVFAGAAAGCLLLVLLLAYLGGPNTVIGAAVLYAAAAAVWFTAAGSLRGRVLAVAVALSWVTLIAWNVRHHVVEVKWAKGARLHEPLFVRWNSFSRVAVQAGPGDSRALEVDAEKAGLIAREDPDLILPAERRALLHQGPGIPFLLRPSARTLILNPGGGEELVRALVGNSRRITAVEANPLVAATVSRERQAQALYARPEVRRVVADGRGFLRREDELYDIIRILPGSTRAALPWGLATVLSDGRLFTVEAFHEYLDRLSDAGLLVVSSSGLDPTLETGRLAGAVLAALRQAGEREPERHLVLFREPLPRSGGFRDTLVASRRPLADADLEQCRRLAADSGVELLSLARLAEDAAGGNGGLTPPSDNRPYLDGAFGRRPDGRGAPAGAPNPARRLVWLAGFSLAAAVLILALPPLVMCRPIARRRDLLGFLPYFVFTGAGSVLVQAGLMQGFFEWLGNPTHALTVAVPAVLVAAGAGSYYSGRVAGGSDRSLIGVLALAALSVATLAVILAPLVGFGGGWPQAAKIAATVLLVMPAGFLMGIPLVAGLARLAPQAAPAARWAWSLYAAAAVLGSVTAVLVAVHFGFRETMLFGGLMYLGALPAIRFCPREEPGSRAARA